jgi:hypothetical protein
MLVGNWLASLLGVRDTGGIDWIRHALQFLVAAIAVAGTSGYFKQRAVSRVRGQLEQFNVTRTAGTTSFNVTSNVNPIPPNGPKPVFPPENFTPPAE